MNFNQSNYANERELVIYELVTYFDYHRTILNKYSLKELKQLLKYSRGK